MKIDSNRKLPDHDLDTVMPLLINMWRKLNKLSGPSDKLLTREFRTVVDGVLKLQQGLEKTQDLVGQDYFEDPDLLGAYILYQWVIHYQEGLTLINELPTPPKRVLDMCSGTGAFAFAALRHGAREVVAIDRSQKALDMAATICGRYGYPITIRKHSALKYPFPVEGKFDLIIVGHCLTELFPDSKSEWPKHQRDWIDQLFKYLTPDGHILFVESSQNHINRRMLMLRDQLVNERIAVQAPCVWTGDCVALQSNSPCYAQREMKKPFVIKEIQRAAQINLGSLKMSYLIVKAPGAHWPALPPKKLYRVISPPIETQTGKRYFLCGVDGKKNLGSHVKELPPEARPFEYLKRGELISIEGALEKQQHFDIIIGTQIKVEAAVGKPLPSPEEEWIG
jgi:SAM-dependent methyltransferase